MSINKDIKQAIDKNLPSQVADSLRERLETIDRLERDVRESDKIIILNLYGNE